VFFVEEKYLRNQKSGDRIIKSVKEKGESEIVIRVRELKGMQEIRRQRSKKGFCLFCIIAKPIYYLITTFLSSIIQATNSTACSAKNLIQKRENIEPLRALSSTLSLSATSSLRV